MIQRKEWPGSEGGVTKIQRRKKADIVRQTGCKENGQLDWPHLPGFDTLLLFMESKLLPPSC